MANPSKPSYTHGSTGTEPSSPVDYANGDELPADSLDFFIHTPFSKIKAIIDTLNTIDADGDGKVDAADTADVADSANAVDGGDVNGQVASAAIADEATTFESRTNYPASPVAGQVVFREDKT